MFGMLKTFACDESGAVTSDWVVLTAAIMGLAAISVASVEAAVTALGPAISQEIENQMGPEGN